MPQGLSRRRRGLIGGLLLALPCVLAGPDPALDPERVARGELVLRAAGCAACHTDPEDPEAFLAGGRALETPFGTFHAPNITPDPEHGIGRWRVHDLDHALRHGRAPDGSAYFPVLPFTSYTRMSTEDLAALWAYLVTRPAVSRPNRPHDLPWWLRWRGLATLWQWLYFDAERFEPDPKRDARWNRGAYLVEALAHCAECHSPRTWLGAIDEGRRFAGTRSGPEGKPVPNITPDRETGIGRWSVSDLAYYLETGMDPDGDFAGGLMAEVIDSGIGHLPPEDLEAIAVYILSLPPIRHAVDSGSEDQRDEFD